MTSDHEIDVVTCAYAGKLFLLNNAAAYGDQTEDIFFAKRKNCLAFSAYVYSIQFKMLSFCLYLYLVSL
jgi:hypothetical protein